MATTGRQAWKYTKAVSLAARTTRTLRHLLPLQGSAQLSSALPASQPASQPASLCDKAESVNSACSTSDNPPSPHILCPPALTSHRRPRHPRCPLLRFLQHPPNTPVSPRRRALLHHRPPRRLHVTAPPNPVREQAYLCSSCPVAFTLPRAGHALHPLKCRRWQAEGGARSGRLVG